MEYFKHNNDTTLLYPVSPSNKLASLAIHPIILRACLLAFLDLFPITLSKQNSSKVINSNLFIPSCIDKTRYNINDVFTL